MATFSNKHNDGRNVLAQRVFYPSFDGGLNLGVPSESLAKNELKEAVNVEFSALTGAMTVRGGLVWSAMFDSDVDFIVPVRGKRGFLARAKGTRKLYYFRWNNIWPVLGELTGDGDLSIAAWNDDYLIASGGKLQRFSDEGLPTLETIETSPEESRFVFVRSGRVGVVSGDDTLTFSGVGDCENWKDQDDTTWTEEDSVYVEIGYKDGMNIDAVIPLSRDLIIFKSPKGETDKGIIWRLTGDFPEWVVLEAAHNTGTFSALTAQTVGNDVFFITPSGLATLSSVTAYGEVKTSWPDRKVSNALSQLIDSSAQLWDIPVKQQLWVLPSRDASEIWVFDYVRGIWTQFSFPKPLIHVTGTDNSLFVFMGKDLYEVNDGYTQDEVKDEGKQTITAKMKLGTLLTGRQVLIKGAYASFEILPQCRAELWLGDFCMPFSYSGSPDYIYDDTDCAYEDDDPLYSVGGTLTSRRRCIIRDWSITPEIRIYGGGCSISTMGLEMVEV